MKLHDFLNEAYSEDRNTKSSIKYALKYLTYYGEGNKMLQTSELHEWGNPRKKRINRRRNT